MFIGVCALFNVLLLLLYSRNSSLMTSERERLAHRAVFLEHEIRLLKEHYLTLHEPQMGNGNGSMFIPSAHAQSDAALWIDGFERTQEILNGNRSHHFHFIEQSQNATFVIAIKSGGPSGFARRDILRTTFLPLLRQRRPDCRFFFALSKHTDAKQHERVLREQNEHGDLVLFEHLEERYELLTRKTFAILQYTHQAFRNFTWLIQLDDDSFINPWLLNDVAATQLQRHRFFGGLINNGGKIILDPALLNYEPNYDDCAHFAPDVSGGTAYLRADH
jgi:hypothetical protein